MKRKPPKEKKKREGRKKGRERKEEKRKRDMTNIVMHKSKKTIRNYTIAKAMTLFGKLSTAN